MKIKIRFSMREEMVNEKGKFHKSMQLVPSMQLVGEKDDEDKIHKVMREALTKTAYKKRFIKKVNL